MKRWERWALHLLTVGISGSGLVYFWMKHLLASQDPFSVVNHPWQPAMLDIHLLLSPLLIFLLGMILHSHIARKLRNKTPSGRRTGMLSLLSFPVMVLSGYGLQLLAEPAWIQAFLVMHLVSGSLFALSYAIHWAVKLADQARQPRGRFAARAEGRQAALGNPAVRTLKGGFILALAAAVCSQAPPTLGAWHLALQAPAEALAGGEMGVLVERQVFLMGTRCTLTVQAADRIRGRAILESLLEVLEQTEAQLSTWRPESSLSLLNQMPAGRPFPLSAPLCRLFEDLHQWRGRTGGAFDPAIGSLIQAWALRQGGRIPSPQELQGALSQSGLQKLHFDPLSCQAVRSAAVTLDAGAFGKGEALDRAWVLSAQKGMPPWMINLGGQIMVHGSPSGASGWSIDVAHPLHRLQAAMQVLLSQGSLAVSGGSQRDLQVNGRRIGHILDPRSGRPADYSGSVLVWHPSALAADILSTALFVMGEEEGISWAQRNDVAACFLAQAEQPRPKCSAAFRNRFPIS